jgi:hypothetical protein
MLRLFMHQMPLPLLATTHNAEKVGWELKEGQKAFD